MRTAGRALQIEYLFVSLLPSLSGLGSLSFRTVPVFSSIRLPSTLIVLADPNCGHSVIMVMQAYEMDDKVPASKSGASEVHVTEGSLSKVTRVRVRIRSG